MSDINNICFVSNDSMCTGCGICAAICPKEAIEMIIDKNQGFYKAQVEQKRCFHCGKCLKCCPPLTWSNKQKTSRYNYYLGDYSKSYVAHSTDEKIRYASASGGFVTSFLIYLLNRRLINGALVTKRSEINPVLSIPFIARTRQEIIESNGSKYSPVKFDEILKEIIDSGKNDFKIAVVGLPCHIEAISQACKINSHLNKAVKYKISLLCGHSSSMYAYYYIFKKLGLHQKEITNIKNRGDGWPGSLKITTKSKVVKLPYRHKYSMGIVLSSPLFIPIACHMCKDAAGFNADLSVSDAWLKEYSDDDQGTNLVLSRNESIDRILDNINKDKSIQMIECDANKIVKANYRVFRNKVDLSHYRMKWYLKSKSDNYINHMNYKNQNKIVIFIQKLFAMHLKAVQKKGLIQWLPCLNDYMLIYLKILNKIKNYR